MKALGTPVMVTFRPVLTAVSPIRVVSSGILDEFAINPDGTLSPIGSKTVPNAVGDEGILAG